MTPQGAIEIIKIAIAEVEWNYPMEYAEAFENAIEALEKQIPKRVIHTQNHHQHFCSTCHHPIKVGRKYCGSCGQALKWGEK